MDSNDRTIERALCPTCGTQFVWDWCQDCYFLIVGGEEVAVATDTLPSTLFKQKVTLHSCGCGKIVAVSVSCNGEESVLNIEEWKRVDWEEPVNMKGSRKRP